MNRHAIVVAFIWAVLTAVGEVLAFTLDYLPFVAAKEASVVDGAFRTLVALGIPVLAFVFAMLIYVVPRFRRRGEPTDDGPPIRTHPRFIAAWFVVTAGLTVFMIIYPGITGLTELSARAAERVDLVVEVEGRQFIWKMHYPEHNVTTFTELVLPVGKHVRFNITSADVLHSFWIPAFRVKIDAVPGLVTHAYATPDKIGSLDNDSGMRLQCAELCGVGHGIMRVSVRVVEQSEFDAWVAGQQ